MKLSNTHIFIIIAVAFILYLFMYKKDTFNNISDETRDQIDKIYDYIVFNDPSYTDYLNFLISIHNTNLHLIDSEVFALFKGSKKRSTFTKEMILEEMKIES